MRRHTSLLVALSLWSFVALSQAPKISAVQRIVSYPFTTVTITGTGFSTNPADLRVRFGNVNGTITTASLTTLEVTVPAMARLSEVEVINVSTRLSAKSPLKFTPTFSGDAASFSAANFASQYYTWPEQIFDLCSCDLDGNGKTDLVGTKFVDNALNNELMLMENTSTVGAQTTTLSFLTKKLTSPQSTYSIACGDLNGDGRPELVATRGGSVTSTQVFVFPNTSSPGAISFGAVVTLNLDAGELGKEVAIRDLNLDGKPDIVVSNGATTNTLYIFQNGLTGAAIDPAQFVTHKKALGATSGGLEVQDFNNDGWPDIATVPFSSGKKLYILVNPANGTADFAAAQPIATDISGSLTLRDITSADFNNDGWLDLVLTDFASHRSFVLTNRKITNPVAFSVSSTLYSTQKAWGVDVADINGDGFADFIVQGQDITNKQLDIFVNSGGAGFNEVTITPPKAGWNIKVADFDGDSKPDIASTVTDGVSAFGIEIFKNRNCHVPVILSDDPLVICNGQTIDVSVVPLQGVSYLWSNGDSGTTATVTDGDIGTLTVTATGESGACSKMSSITVSLGVGSQPAPPVITAPDGVCAGNTLTLTTPTVADGYIWAGPNEFSSTVQNPPGIPNVTSANGGVYSLRVRAGDCLSDPTEKTIAVVEPTAFTINANPGPLVCSGQPISLSVANDANYNYQWKKDGSNITGATSATYSVPSAAAANEGSYTVLISHKTITCSNVTEALVVDVVTAPVASFTKAPTGACVGTEITFTSTSTVDGAATVSYSWAFGDGAVGSGTSVAHIYLAPQSVTATLTVSYSGVSGCSSTANDMFTVADAVAPTIAVENNAIEICGDGSENLTLTVTGTFTKYTWTPGGQSTDIITVNKPDTYSVVTEDANGCIGNAEVVLTSKAGCEAGQKPPIDVQIPKAFTPNGDGQNESWVIVGIDNPEYGACMLNVFDGRGMRIFQVQASGFPATGWDGTYNGREVPAGTYFYVISCPDRAQPVTGSVLIVR